MLDDFQITNATAVYAKGIELSFLTTKNAFPLLHSNGRLHTTLTETMHWYSGLRLMCLVSYSTDDAFLWKVSKCAQLNSVSVMHHKVAHLINQKCFLDNLVFGGYIVIQYPQTQMYSRDEFFYESQPALPTQPTMFLQIISCLVREMLCQFLGTC